MRSVIRWYYLYLFTCSCLLWYLLWCASHPTYFIWRATVSGSLPSDHVPSSRYLHWYSYFICSYRMTSRLPTNYRTPPRVCDVLFSTLNLLQTKARERNIEGQRPGNDLMWYHICYGVHSVYVHVDLCQGRWVTAHNLCRSACQPRVLDTTWGFNQTKLALPFTLVFPFPLPCSTYIRRSDSSKEERRNRIIVTICTHTPLSNNCVWLYCPLIEVCIPLHHCLLKTDGHGHG